MGWQFIDERLGALREQGLFREPDDGVARIECESCADALGVRALDASSNDYLGHATLAVSRETTEGWPDTGAGASRLINGTHPLHVELEAELADWVGLPSALLFTSGYAANVGVMSAMPAAGDLIISDVLNHASIIDGCRLSAAEVAVVPHLNASTIDALLSSASPPRRCWVVTESYFSMDGDSPELAKLREACDDHQALLVVDEAHSLGVFGPGGSGLCRANGLVPDILIGTFGKAMGAQGAFVAAAPSVRAWLWNKARSFVYSTATSPNLAHCVLRNVRKVRADDSGRETLARWGSLLRAKLIESQISVPPESHGPIVPIVLGDSDKAVAAARIMRDQGVLAHAIRPPTVPVGSARIRLTLKATFSREDVLRLAEVVVQACKRS